MGDFTNKSFSGYSNVNSSTDVLSAGATFTGDGEINDAADVMVTVKTDQNGTLYMEFSPDGTNWDSSLSFNYDTARINPPHILVKGVRYYRTRFTNTSASAQTYFRLQTEFGSFEKLTAALNGTLAENYDALVTRPNDFRYEVAENKRQGHRTWNKFGYNPDVDSSPIETVWAVGGSHTILTTASTLIVVSSDVNDTSAGTGARTVFIEGIDGDYLYASEVVTMNGTSNVTTTTSFLGVNRIVVLSSGTSDSNEGNITVTATTGGSTQAYIPANQSVTQQLIFFTQINHMAMADWLMFNVNKISGGGSPRVTIKGWSYSYVTGCKYEVFRYTMDTSVENHFELRPSQPFVIGGREVFYFEADSDTANTVVNGRLSLVEIRNS